MPLPNWLPQMATNLIPTGPKGVTNNSIGQTWSPEGVWNQFLDKYVNPSFSASAKWAEEHPESKYYWYNPVDKTYKLRDPNTPNPPPPPPISGAPISPLSGTVINASPVTQITPIPVIGNRPQSSQKIQYRSGIPTVPLSSVPAASGPEALANQRNPSGMAPRTSSFRLPNYYDLPKLPSLDLDMQRKRQSTFSPFPKYRA